MSNLSIKTPPDLTQARYLLSFHRVFHFIDRHLQDPLNLNQVAEIAAFSPYHFHRLFKELTGETLNQYILRKRMETAAALLMRESLISISDISYKVGFNSNAAFTRAFKRHYGLNPTQFKKLSPSRYAKIKSKKGQLITTFETYVCSIEELKAWIKMNGTVEVKTFEKLKFASLEHIGKAGLSETFGRLMTWASKKGLLAREPQLGLIYHDSYKTTSPDKVRMSVGILITESCRIDDGLGLLEIPKGNHIVGRFEIDISEFETAWNSMFVWMNEHGYKRRNVPPFELYRNNFNEHPEKKFILDLCIPVE